MKQIKNSVLIVDDEKVNLQTLNDILKEDYTVYTVKNGYDAIKVAKKYLPDIILLDILMPDIDGFEVFTILKKDLKTCNIPIIFITCLGNPEDEERALSMGASDYIVKPFNPTAVRLRIRNQMLLLNQIEAIKELSTTDELTQLPNRRSFESRMNLEWDHAKRSENNLSILILDIDDFKKYNDTYGHLQGDAVLKTVAKITVNTLRRSIDFAARWGGEEFVCILPDTDSKGAQIVAEKIRKGVESTPIPCEISAGGTGVSTKVTISIGVNTCIPTLSGMTKELFNGADKALYKAKRSGKNKVVAL